MAILFARMVVPFRGSFAVFVNAAFVFLVLWLLLVLGHGLAQARRGS